MHDMVKSKIQDKADPGVAWRKTPRVTDAVQQAVPAFVHHTHAGGGVLHEYGYLTLGVSQVNCLEMPPCLHASNSSCYSLQMPQLENNSVNFCRLPPAPSLLTSCPCLVHAQTDRASGWCKSSETTQTNHPTQCARIAFVGTLACRTRQRRRGAGTNAARPTTASAGTAHSQRS
jgi:hypothetical protein